MASPNTPSVGHASRPRTPGSESGKRVGFARPTLIIPPPGQRYYSPPSGATLNSVYIPTATGTIPEMYGRKQSMFMFDQFNGIRDFTMSTAKSGLGIGEKCSFWLYNKIRSWSRKWFTHWFLTIILVLYTFCGALTFTYIEGQNEKIVDGDIRRQRYRLIRELRNLSLEMPKETSYGEWEGEAARRLMRYESQVLDAYEKHKLLILNPGGNVWGMWNAVVYCATIYTTIGYGHLYPSTRTGMALTIVYSLIGIPLFLIALTDFGKLFTRGIKFLWSFVRRLYYTGSCRKVRKTAHVQEIFKGAQMMYEIATFRRPSQVVDTEDPQQQTSDTLGLPGPSVGGEDTPTTPAISNFEIDDEFNLPISLALFILVAYIFIGALGFWAVEEWDFFASFYFVFISMSTIGFGDFVPKNPIATIGSIVYLCFGLALMSMCINVVQAKLSDTFKHASATIGATMGIDAETNSIPSAEQVEMPGVHNTVQPATPENQTAARNDKENDNTLKVPERQ